MKIRKFDFIALLSAAGLLALAVLAWFFLDERIFSWLCRHHDRLLNNHILMIFEMAGKAWVVIWLLMCWTWATGRLRPSVVALMALVFVAAGVLSVKEAVRRPRPYDVIHEAAHADYGRNNLIRSWSFPSGDTATIFAVTFALSAFVRRRWLALLLAISTGIGLLRMLVFAHYLSDVLAGAAVGVVSGLLALKINEKWDFLHSLDIARYRSIALLGVILVPVMAGLSESWGYTFDMLTTYGLLVVIVFVAWKAAKRFY